MRKRQTEKEGKWSILGTKQYVQRLKEGPCQPCGFINADPMAQEMFVRISGFFFLFLQLCLFVHQLVFTMNVFTHSLCYMVVHMLKIS